MDYFKFLWLLLTIIVFACLHAKSFEKLDKRLKSIEKTLKATKET